MKGSDASWEHNNEPPEKVMLCFSPGFVNKPLSPSSCLQFLDYSDDEQEKAAKSKSHGKSRQGKAQTKSDAYSEKESAKPRQKMRQNRFR